MLSSLWNYLRRMARDSILAGASDAVKEMHQNDTPEQFAIGVRDLQERLTTTNTTIPRLQNGQTMGRKARHD